MGQTLWSDEDNDWAEAEEQNDGMEEEEVFTGRRLRCNPLIEAQCGI